MTSKIKGASPQPSARDESTSAMHVDHDSAAADDFIVVSEFSEHQGPIVVQVIPESMAAVLDLSEFVVKIMAVDVNKGSDELGKFNRDSQVVVDVEIPMVPSPTFTAGAGSSSTASLSTGGSNSNQSSTGNYANFAPASMNRSTSIGNLAASTVSVSKGVSSASEALSSTAAQAQQWKAYVRCAAGCVRNANDS
jgi:hypothetical protein